MVQIHFSQEIPYSNSFIFIIEEFWAVLLKDMLLIWVCLLYWGTQLVSKLLYL